MGFMVNEVAFSKWCAYLIEVRLVTSIYKVKTKDFKVYSHITLIRSPEDWSFNFEFSIGIWSEKEFKSSPKKIIFNISYQNIFCGW